MNQKEVLYIIILLGVVLAVFSSTEETIFSESVRGSQTIDAKGRSFNVKVLRDVGAYIDNGNYSFLVTHERCEWYGNLMFCVGIPSFVYRNPVTWEYVYETILTIVHREGFSINKTIDKTDMLIGDRAHVYVRLSNDGYIPIDNINFIDAYPAQLEVDDVEGCTLEHNMVRWNGRLEPRTWKACLYTLIGRDSMRNVSEAKVTYEVEGETRNTASERMRIKVQNHSLRVLPTLNITKEGINGSINVSFNLENIYESMINVWWFEISVPRSLEVIKRSYDIRIEESNEMQQKLVWEGDLDSGETVNLTMTLRPKIAGNFTIQYSQHYLVNIFERKLSNQINITVNCDCIEIRHKTSKAGTLAHLNVELYNPSRDNHFNNIRVNVSSSIPGTMPEDFPTPIVYRSIAPEEALVLFDGYMAADQTHHYDVIVDYDSEYGQHFTEQKSIIIG